MHDTGPDSPSTTETAQTSDLKPVAGDDESMTAEDRRQQVLTVLEGAGVAGWGSGGAHSAPPG